MRLWCWGFAGRLFCCRHGTVHGDYIPQPVASPLAYLLVVIAEHVFSTFTNTVMFVAVAAFHARIADPVIGGTYMTLLAT